MADRVKAMCFDTTSSNTGQKKGACTLIEDKLEKELLNLACRHHISELLIGAVITVMLGPSKSPKVAIFKRWV